MTPSLTILEPRNATDARTDPFPYGEPGSDPGPALPRYASRGVLRPDDPAGAVGAAGRLTCPACDAETVNGAGLFACRECSWTGSLR